MPVIIATIAGGILFIWGGVFALLKWISPIEKKHLLGYAGFVTVVCGVLIGLVLHTFITRQEAAQADTRARLDQELGRFQDQLGGLTEKLMGQIAEKAELTQSEWEVRGNLQTERAKHTQARESLAKASGELAATRRLLSRRTSAYVDSLATERANLDRTEQQLAETLRELEEKQETLTQTRSDRDRAKERIAAQQRNIKQLETDLGAARKQAKETQLMIAGLQSQLKQESVLQEKSLYTLQAAVDTIYRKVMKRPRIPEPEGDR